jgi:hypothetical protein
MKRNNNYDDNDDNNRISVQIYSTDYKICISK